jgi:hypothetical protein
LRYAKYVSTILNITVFTPVINNWYTCKHYYLSSYHTILLINAFLWENIN